MDGGEGYGGETVRAMARELYGIELTEERAAEVARQAASLAGAARRAGREPDFDDEPAGVRRALARAARERPGA